MKKDIKAIVFDMDDTLYPERDYIRSGYRAVADFLADEQNQAGEIFAILWDIFSHDPREKVFDQVLTRLNIDPDPLLITKLIALYREHKPQICPLPGVIELLAKLRAGGYKLGLISDGYLPGQQYKLEALGLKECFDHIIFTESLGRENWKPAPLAFEMMARALDTTPGECLYIGDNLKKDFISPNALGWHTVCFRNEFQVHFHHQPDPAGQPQHYISDLSELLPLVQGVLLQ
ncbi:MAG: HAD family hydrolase [Sedimentisphaerales bacterium]|nr:HAD family hydrolase [Sedimentisphaerales bacterium]MBN2842891.1 HAD family hydrolase [Sedimentisphaerales bacterium]